MKNNEIKKELGGVKERTIYKVTNTKKYTTNKAPVFLILESFTFFSSISFILKRFKIEKANKNKPADMKIMLPQKLPM
ncbi:MAG: hypothetical protein OIN88_04210 [Candidatus Methanoperedens sp.]|nr:hypothetical protein [Candidatus Methanoperedens sp.]HLB70092.1 hypothetical protein [Candidatus Methanoperedens sp.]